MTTNVEVEIDLDEIPNYELVSEICKRIRYETMREVYQKKIKEEFERLAKALGMSDVFGIIVETIDDEDKMKHFSKVFQQYTSDEIETRLPSKEQ